MTKRMKNDDDVIQKMFRKVMSDQPLVDIHPIPDRCQFCGLFHFGDCAP